MSEARCRAQARAASLLNECISRASGSPSHKYLLTSFGNCVQRASHPLPTIRPGPTNEDPATW